MKRYIPLILMLLLFFYIPAEAARVFRDVAVKSLAYTLLSTFSDGDTTPPVSGSSVFKSANTGATTITMFDSGTTGQLISVLFTDGDTTIDFTSTNLKGNGGVDWAATTGSSMIALFDGTDWYCTVGTDLAAGLVDIAGLAVTDSNFIVGDGSNWVAETGNTARTSLGLGTGDTPQFTKLGLGTANPTFPLTFAAVTGEKFDLYKGGGYIFGVEPNEFRFALGTPAGKMTFRIGNGAYNTAATETMRITADGVGIMTTGPDRKLDVLDATNPQLRLTHTDGSVFADFQVDGNGDLTVTPTGDEIKVADWVRHTSASYRRYYHLSVGGFDPGASGATWTNPDANTTGGWQLNAVGETLIAGTDIHADWDGASDIMAEISFALNVGGSNTDTVDLQLIAYYNGIGDTSTKTQTVEVATVTDGTQYKVYKATFTINYDEGGNVVDAGDNITFILNLETDTSEIDDIIVLHGSFYYNTTHLGIEANDT